MPSPVRINKDLQQNARAPFFWIVRQDIAEIWVCYLDGTWERESRRGVQDIGKLSMFGESKMRWAKQFYDAGYPYWQSMKDKAAWVNEHKDRLLWDGDRGMFVPSVPQQRRQETMPAR